MNSITLLSCIAFSRNSRISALVISLVSRGRSLDRERVDRSTHLVAEHAVHELVLLDPAEPVEAPRDHLGAEVVASAGQVLDAHLGIRQGLLDPLLELLGARHAVEDSAARRPALTRSDPLLSLLKQW